MKTEILTINKKEYTIKELSYGVVMKLVKTVDAEDLQNELTKLAVTCDGKPVDFESDDLGFSDGLKIATLVSEVHNLGGETKNG